MRLGFSKRDLKLGRDSIDGNYHCWLYNGRGTWQGIASGLWSLRMTPGQQPAKKQGPQSYNQKETNSADHLMTLELNSSPMSPNKNTASWLLKWDTDQRTQLSQIQPCRTTNSRVGVVLSHHICGNSLDGNKKWIQRGWEFWQATKINIKNKWNTRTENCRWRGEKTLSS